jgi:hypothetical protein
MFVKVVLFNEKIPVENRDFIFIREVAFLFFPNNCLLTVGANRYYRDWHSCFFFDKADVTFELFGKLFFRS